MPSASVIGLWDALQEREKFYAHPDDWTDEDGMRLGELEGIVGDQGGYTAEAVTDTILRRMPDYVNYICPQFAETDINFQRVPTVDTSNPFIARWIPTPDESMVVIRLKNPRGIDFPYLLSMIPHSFMSRANSIVIHGAKLDLAMQLILTPLILQLMERKRRTI